MDDKKDYELFNGKTLSNVFEDIYNNSKNTGSQVGTLVDQLKKFVTNLDRAVIVVPLIREYLDVKVKSDEHLVKLADTIQRMLKAEKTINSEDGLLISEEEKKQLLEEVPSYEQIRNKEKKKLETLDEQVAKIQDELNDTSDDQEEKEEDGVQKRQE